jgi:hypothetical protein
LPKFLILTLEKAGSEWVLARAAAANATTEAPMAAILAYLFLRNIQGNSLKAFEFLAVFSDFRKIVK